MLMLLMLLKTCVVSFLQKIFFLTELFFPYTPKMKYIHLHILLAAGISLLNLGSLQFLFFQLQDFLFLLLLDYILCLYLFRNILLLLRQVQHCRILFYCQGYFASVKINFFPSLFTTLIFSNIFTPCLLQ